MKRLPHKNTKENFPEDCGKGCGGYSGKGLVSLYLKTKDMLENWMGKQKP